MIPNPNKVEWFAERMTNGRVAIIAILVPWAWSFVDSIPLLSLCCCSFFFGYQVCDLFYTIQMVRLKAINETLFDEVANVRFKEMLDKMRSPS